MKKTSKILTGLAIVAVTFGLGACTKDSTDNTDKVAASQTKAADSTDGGKAADSTEKDTADKKSSGTEDDSYCAAIDEFTNASLNGLKDVDMTNPDSVAKYAENVRDAARSVADNAPTSTLADLWEGYAERVGSGNSSASAKFNTEIQSSVSKYCANYDFKYGNK